MWKYLYRTLCSFELKKEFKFLKTAHVIFHARVPNVNLKLLTQIRHLDWKKIQNLWVLIYATFLSWSHPFLSSHSKVMVKDMRLLNALTLTSRIQPIWWETCNLFLASKGFEAFLTASQREKTQKWNLGLTILRLTTGHKFGN